MKVRTLWWCLLVLGSLGVGIGLMHARMLPSGDGGALHSAPASGIPAVVTGNTSTFDILPLTAGREWAYDYYWKHKTGSAGMWDYFTDSGRVSYVVVDSVQSTDTTITWSIRETAHLSHHQWRESIGRSMDTVYWSDSVVNVSLVEHVTGLHKVECNGRVWSFRTWKYGINGGPYPSAPVYRFWADSLLDLWQTDLNAESQHLYFSASLGLFKRELHFSSGVYFSDDILATLVDPSDPTSAPDTEAQPDGYVLAQNYPNPFNPSTRIRYGLPQKSTISLVVFNTLGQQVGSLFQGEQEPGHYEVNFDASGLPSGVYFYRLAAGDFVQVRKLLLLK